MGARRKERINRGVKVRTEGIYAISSIPDLLYLIGPQLIFILLLLALPVILTLAPYWRRVINIACVYALLSISFDFLANCVGLVCLGGSLFVGTGGYLSAIFNVYFQLPVCLSIPLASICGAIFSTIIILPCLPLKGVYFAIVTLIYPLLFTRIIEALDILGGTNGITGLQSFPDPWTEQYIIIGITILILFSMRRFLREDIGIVLKAIKDNDQSVRASGINITMMKSLALFIASLIGCFSGAYIAHLYMWAGISLFALDFSLIPIAATVIGGGGILTGAVVGSFILVPLSEFLRFFGTFRIVIYSIILTSFVVLKSEGIVTYIQRKYHQFERWVEI